MTNGAIAIPLAMICLAYLFFSNDPKVRPRTVWKAESPLQPFLALWGLFWFSFIGLFFTVHVTADFLVIFQGYKAWTRWNNQYWSVAPLQWGFTMVPFTIIALFLVLLLISPLIVDRAFRPDSEYGSIRNISPILPKPQNRDGKLKRIVNAILEAI